MDRIISPLDPYRESDNPFRQVEIEDLDWFDDDDYEYPNYQYDYYQDYNYEPDEEREWDEY